jgi:hypothetical protein
MDAKMDSGYLGPDENHAQALEYDYDVVRELRPEEVLGIMDQLLCHEVRCAFSTPDDIFSFAHDHCSADGMAYGPLAFADTFHLRIPR